MLIIDDSAIYASSVTTWQEKAWASTTVAFGIWGGIVMLGPLIPIIKHVRIQMIVMMAVSVAFMGMFTAVCNDRIFTNNSVIRGTRHLQPKQFWSISGVLILGLLPGRHFGSRHWPACATGF